MPGGLDIGRGRARRGCGQGVETLGLALVQNDGQPGAALVSVIVKENRVIALTFVWRRVRFSETNEISAGARAS